MKKSNNLIFKITACLVFTFTLFSIFYSCDNREEGMLLEDLEVAPSKTVHAEPAKLINYRATVYSSGKLTSTEATKLSFGMPGKIAKIYVNAGQSVKAGQVLATLKGEELDNTLKQTDIAIQQAELSIQNAELLLAKAKRDYKNTNGLYQDSVATLEQLQNAKLQVESFENQLKVARQTEMMHQQKQSAVQINQEYASIIAPSDGMILDKFAKKQEIIVGGMPILLFASQNKAKVIKVNITDKEIVDLQIGDNTKVFFDAYPNQVFEGKVQEIAQMADPVLNTFEVSIALAKTQQKLFDGFIGQVEITVGQPRPLISIPIDALVSANGNKGKIFILEDRMVVAKEITIFKLEKGKLLVESGIEENDDVIISGTGNIEADESVRVRD